MVTIDENQSRLPQSNKKSSSTSITPASSVEPPEPKPPVAASLEEPDGSEVKATAQLCLIASSMSCDDWRGALTTFDGFTNTRPDGEFENISWDDVCNHLCPKEPKIISEKRLAKYVVPCLLKDAPLVGKTLKTASNNGQSTTGKMRSKSHVTKAAIIIIDIDGLQIDEFIKVRKKITEDRITFLAYTTFSHGSPDKPGIRARLVIPIDRQLTADEYLLAWHGFDQHYCQGKVGRADSSGARLHQQQSTWCCHPSRVDLARTKRNEGGVVSADALIEIGRHAQVRQSSKSKLSTQVNSSSGDKVVYPPSDANKVADRCRQIGAFRDNKGAGQSEPLWFDCLGITAHCTDGEAISQGWSSGYAGYDKNETEKKITHRIKTPPTTCDQFKKSHPTGCDGCTYSTCKSPIALGRDDSEFIKIAASSDDTLGIMEKIQKQFCLINISGKIWVLDQISLQVRTGQDTAKKLMLSNKSDGSLLITRAVKAQFPQVDAVKITRDFFVNPQTTCYSGVEFNPAGGSEKNLNLWVGPTITSQLGTWELIASYLLEVICDGNTESYTYLVNFIAHALQRPEEKPGILIVLLGGQGTGKGTLGRILRLIWSATYLQVHNIDTVTGNFNASLERTFIVFMDEALFSGDRRASDALKSLVTEPVIHINEKHQPARQTHSYHRFFAATNANHLKNTDRDDRRDFTLRVSEAYKGNHAYWQALHNEIENDGVAAMVHDLLAMDLSGFNVRNKPHTKELLEQKLQSLSPIPRWWFSCLTDGGLTLGRDVLGEDRDWSDFVSTADIIAGVTQVAGRKLYQIPIATEVIKEMSKLCPSTEKKQTQKKYSKKRGLSLPSLEQARAEFEKYIGGKVDW